MSLSNRSFLAAAWEFGSVSSQGILQFIVIAVLARHLTPADFGLVAVANMAIGFLAMFSEIGVGPALIQKSRLTDSDVSAAFTFSLLLGILGMFFLWFLAPFVASYFEAPDATDILRALSLTLMISSYNTVARATLERKLDFKRLAQANIGSYTLAFGVIGISLAVYGVGVWAIVIATLTQVVLRALFLGKMSFQFSIGSLRGNAIKGIVRFGAGFSFVQILNYTASQIDNLIVGKTLGMGMLGFYQIAFQIMDMPRRFLGSVIDKVMFSAMSRMQDDIVRLKTAYLQSIELANILMLPISVLGIILAPELVRVYLGDQWLEIVVPLQILLVQVPLRSSNRLAEKLGFAAGRNYGLAKRKVLYVVLVGIAVFIGKEWGLTGVAWALNAAVFINFLIMAKMALSISDSSWKNLFSSWGPGMLLAIIVLLFAGASVSVTRDMIDSNLMRIIITLAVTFTAVGASVVFRPAILGSSGIWLLGKISEKIPRRNRHAK